MNGFKIKKENGKYYFALYPSNNHHQRMGQSKTYRTRDECKTAMLEFLEYVGKHTLNKETNGKVKIIREKENGINRYWFKYMRDGELIFYRTIKYGQRESCKKGINSIYENRNKYTKELFD